MATRSLRYFRNFVVGSSVGLGAVYVWDQSFNRRSLSRTCYAIYNAFYMGIDYKVNFREGHDIEALHERCAERLYNVIRKNKGLYVKVGQSIAIQGNMLPAPYQIRLSKLFDDAPQDSWEECESILTSELGKSPSEVFTEINHEAVASASIAQVHKAKLRSGEDVAVKIQHADIPKSTFWDLSTYKFLVWVFDRFVFNMPMYFMGKYIAEQVQLETDFTVELRNAEVMKSLVEGDNEMRNKVYIPKLYHDYSSPRVLVMEWIDGASLSDREAVSRDGYDIKNALTTVFKVLTKEAFEWGVVHSDPHPGNWILRPNPKNHRQQQLVMLDHGLYVYMGEQLRTQYAQLWRAIFKRNMPEITRITSEWGFGDPKLFASATMLQPYDEETKNLAHSNFREEEKKAERFKTFLKDSEKIPLELVFVGRTQRILQGLNQFYGSPVNRLHILVDESLKVPAPKSEIQDNWRIPLLQRATNWLYKRLVLLVADLVFTSLRVKQYFTNEDPETIFDESLMNNGADILIN